VQPLKALTAVAVARKLPAEVITAAGLIIGAVLLALSFGRLADHISRLFTVTVVRALQFGVGLLLVVAAIKLGFAPPDVFSAAPPTGASPMLWSAPRIPGAQAFFTAAVLLVIPQLPLTFGNAVVAVTDVAHRLFDERAHNVTPRNVCRSAGIGNVVAAVVGGMPMCHGSSGLTAHHRLGARTAGMSLILGGALITIGVVFGDQAPALLGQLPPVILAVLLAYAGVRHAWLVADLRGWRLAAAVVTGAAGAATGNLLVTMLGAMAVTGSAAMLDRSRRGRGSPPAATRAESAPPAPAPRG
jgi:MFS superfamily sulfate permease-like transporter